MDSKHFGMIAATVVITALITISIQVQVSNIEGLSDFSADRKKFSGQKIAGSFHVLTSGEEFGDISDIRTRRESNGQCTLLNVEGFGPDESLRFAFGDGRKNCNKPSRPISLSYNSGDLELMEVGGASE